MKILSLNAWGGRVNPEILDFVAAWNGRADAFCFQEMMRDTGETEFDPVLDPREIRRTVETFSELLPDYEHRFSNFYGDDYGLATFVHRDVGIRAVSECLVYGQHPRRPLAPGYEGEHCRKILITELGNDVRLVNFHGLWIRGYGKGDHDHRIEQSRRILETLHPFGVPTVLMGGFNLDPDTESMGMLERAGFRNLVKEYGITDTRTPLYEKTVSRYADYALVTPDVPVTDFRVLPDVVSDHAPILLEIEA